MHSHMQIIKHYDLHRGALSVDGTGALQLVIEIDVFPLVQVCFSAASSMRALRT